MDEWIDGVKKKKKKKLESTIARKGKTNNNQPGTYYYCATGQYVYCSILDMANYNPSDLTSVLETLSSLSKAPPENKITSRDNINYDSYEPSDTITVPPPRACSAEETIAPRTATNAPTPAAAAAAASINPSSITTWPPALKYVMQTAAVNEALQARIRHLIQSQHDHERQWWRGREALVQKQEVRAERKSELDRVL